MKNTICALVIAITCSTLPMRVYAADIASGLTEFVYQFLYMNIGITSCKEITDKENSKMGVIEKINSLIDASNRIAEKEVLDKNEVKEYLDSLYDYCEQNPNDLLFKALAKIGKKIFTGDNDVGSRNVFYHDNSNSAGFWSSVRESDRNTNSPYGSRRDSDSQSGPQIIN